MHHTIKSCHFICNIMVLNYGINLNGARTLSGPKCYTPFTSRFTCADKNAALNWNHRAVLSFDSQTAICVHCTLYAASMRNAHRNMNTAHDQMIVTSCAVLRCNWWLAIASIRRKHVVITDTHSGRIRNAFIHMLLTFNVTWFFSYAHSLAVTIKFYIDLLLSGCNRLVMKLYRNRSRFQDLIQINNCTQRYVHSSRACSSSSENARKFEA